MDVKATERSHVWAEGTMPRALAIIFTRRLILAHRAGLETADGRDGDVGVFVVATDGVHTGTHRSPPTTGAVCLTAVLAGEVTAMVKDSAADAAADASAYGTGGEVSTIVAARGEHDHETHATDQARPGRMQSMGVWVTHEEAPGQQGSL